MGLFRRGNKDAAKATDLPIIGAVIEPVTQPGPNAQPDPNTPVPDGSAGVDPDVTLPVTAAGSGFIGRRQRNLLPEIPSMPAGGAPIISPSPGQTTTRSIIPTGGQSRPLREQTCPTCSEGAPSDAKFCEACGTDLVGGEALIAAPKPLPSATEPCVSCAADPAEIEDGYCGQCGTRQPAPRDHFEYDLAWVASVSDKGLRHHHNEDASAIAVADEAAVVVVCDGVSSTSRPEEASELAADRIRDLLVQAVETGAGIEEAMRDAIEAAHHEVAALADSGPGEAPSCTVVAAIMETRDDGTLHTTLGWLGDSRAYWIDASDDGSLTATQLTIDHSWAIDQRALGDLDEETIAADARAHSITRWLGADSTDHTPDIGTHTAASGRLLVCTDGLWNYAAEEPAMAELIGRFAGTVINTAQELVAFAKHSGGHDNITVALVDVAARTTRLSPAPDPGATATPGTVELAADSPINSIVLPDETPSHNAQPHNAQTHELPTHETQTHEEQGDIDD